MAKRILLIEPDPAVRDALAFSLGLEGFVVRSTGALDKEHSVGSLGSADCLIFAHEPTSAEAPEACASIQHAYGGLPTIVLATNPTRALRERLEGIGAHVVEKPLIGSTLSDLLTSMFQRGRAS